MTLARRLLLLGLLAAFGAIGAVLEIGTPAEDIPAQVIAARRG